MPLSLNEIRDRASLFSKEWSNDAREDAEAKSFWDGFFNVFGISRRRVATFEQMVSKSNNRQGYIDLLWKGTMLIEHKSKGQDLDKAYEQAKDYFSGLKENELPRYILVCDFERLRLYDLEENWQQEFKLNKFVDNIHLFDFVSGRKRHVFKEQDPVNIKAAELMGKLHDQLKIIGYCGHDLEVYLVRLLYCLFADSTSIFEKGIFREYIDLETAQDGSNLAPALASLFEILNQHPDSRLKNLPDTLNAFRFVNGRLFSERLPMASFDAKMRQALLDCCALDWSRISPAIFGSLFQSVMDDKARRNLGAHYTSEKNIMKLIKPLFLDELWAEFEKLKADKKPLDNFQRRLSELRFLDPACGCGNFLIIAYRELRLLEIEVLKVKFKNQIATNIDHYVNVNVDQFYGIEYEEFPAQIAQVAMWLIDHQMNQLITESFGNQYYVRLPLTKSAKIIHGNALRIDWQSLLDKMPWDKGTPRYNYIFGNPPFIGKKEQNERQKADMILVFNGVNATGVLDYVSSWYIRAAQYMQAINKKANQSYPTKCAFVSTNSITQGEQVSILWNELLNKYNITIHFAHHTFKWNNEAKGNAAVHVVIIGFGNFENINKKIFLYENIKGEPFEITVKNITPYLVEGNNVFITNKKKPICNVPEMNYGSMPIDNGHLIVTDEDKKNVLSKEPNLKNIIRPYTGGEEFINNKKRWCIWLQNVSPSEIKNSKFLQERIKLTKKFRENSNREATQKLSFFPGLFGEIRQPATSYILIPKVSSENRRYIPIGIIKPKTIASGSCLIIPDADVYTFGVLTSIMHMVWIKNVCGRLESRYQYSNSIVYNNFPWPDNPADKSTKAVETAAQAVLDARLKFPNNSLADLYDPTTMPPVLVKAHQALDKAVDACYRPQPFLNDAKRIEFLFELYDHYTAGLFAGNGKKKKGK